MNEYKTLSQYPAFTKHVQKICAKQKHTTTPAPILINMEKDVEEALEYMVDEYETHGVMPFDNGLDEYILLKFSENEQENQESYYTEEDAGVYGLFDGVMGHILKPSLAEHIGERQVEEYLEGLPDMAEHAATVIFVPEEPDRNMRRLVREIKEALPELVDLTVTKDYSRKSMEEATILNFPEQTKKTGSRKG